VARQVRAWNDLANQRLRHVLRACATCRLSRSSEGSRWLLLSAHRWSRAPV